jgi:hypothetical protein
MKTEVTMYNSQLTLLVALLTVVIASFPALAEDPPTFLLMWGSEGSGNGEFSYPMAAACDSHGYVYVADFFNGPVPNPVEKRNGVVSGC